MSNTIARQWLILFLPLVLWIAALNPFLGPEIYDDVVYYSAAESIASGHGYQFWNQVVADWPPLFSILLSIPLLLGIQSIVVSKLMVIAFAFLAILFVHRLFQSEKRQNPLLATFIFALMPYAFIWTTRVMTEWLFIALTYAFLYFFNRLQDGFGTKKPLLNAIFLGLLFYSCMMTRYAGVFLIVPIIAQSFYREKPFRISVEQLIILTLGLGLFIVTWFLPIYLMTHSGIAASTYYSDPKSLVSFSFSSIFLEISTLFLNTKFISHLFPKFLSKGLLLIPLVFCALGIFSRIKTKQFRNTDWWVLSILLISFFHSSKYNRYFIPIAPFLVSYFLDGIEKIALYWTFKAKKWVVGFGIIWSFLFFSQDLYLLIKGNNTSYGGLSFFASPTYQDFYKGYWNDLYRVAEVINSFEGKGAEGIAFDEELKGEKYLWFFTKRSIVPLSKRNNEIFLVIAADNKNYDQSKEFTQLLQTGTMTLYKR